MPEAAKRKRVTTRHPALAGRDPSVWHADLVGVVPRYCRTEAAFRRRQEASRQHVKKLRAEGRIGTRKGVPDGYAGRREEVTAIRKQAKAEAEAVAETLMQRRVWDVPTNTDEEKALAALTCALSISLDPTVKRRERLAAARLVLNFTKATPPRVSTLQLDTADDWLAELAKQKPAAHATGLIPTLSP